MGWSLRQLAKEVGLSAPTLYAYFANKHAIYDAMFKEGYEALEEVSSHWTLDPRAFRASFTSVMQSWFEFCTTDATRYQLMFQRVIPDFVPSDEAYAASVAVYERLRSEFAEVGVTDDADLDLWTAIATGLTDQQISNDPGGDRWKRLIGTAVDLFCDQVGLPQDPSETETNGEPSQ